MICKVIERFSGAESQSQVTVTEDENESLPRKSVLIRQPVRRRWSAEKKIAASVVRAIPLSCETASVKSSWSNSIETE